MPFNELIARLEAASEGSTELDRAIRDAVRLPRDDGSEAFPYTSVMDAALELLPRWASYELTRSAAGPPTFTRCRLWDWRCGPLMSDPGNEWKSEGNRPLPINICIAALMARQATGGGDAV